MLGAKESKTRIPNIAVHLCCSQEYSSLGVETFLQALNVIRLLFEQPKNDVRCLLAIRLRKTLCVVAYGLNNVLKLLAIDFDREAFLTVIKSSNGVFKSVNYLDCKIAVPQSLEVFRECGAKAFHSFLSHRLFFAVTHASHPCTDASADRSYARNRKRRYSNFLILLRKLHRLVSYAQRFVSPILNICRLKMPDNMPSAVAHNTAPLDILTSS